MKKLPTISIRGKEYVMVKDRILAFNENFANGSIRTEKTEHDGRVEFRAVVFPDVANPERYFTGHSQASWDDQSSMVNKTSALENAETSAVGRALAMMGIGVLESIASADEVVKAVTPKENGLATPAQVGYIKKMMQVKRISLEEILETNNVDDLADLTSRQASETIQKLKVHGQSVR